MLYDSLPNINCFKVFGCLCFASTILAHRSKLQSRARKSVFLGYKSSSKGYVLCDLASREIFISRNVVFHEHILPYFSSTTSSTSNWQYHSSSQLPAIDTTEPLPTSPPTDILPTPATSQSTNSLPTSASHANKVFGHYPLSNFISHANLSIS